jgi:predicted DsbA family dithiol-disulfide isomerase
MTIYKVKDFTEIDFVSVDPSCDKIILPDGAAYFFSDYMCDNCWTGGTVLETDKGKKKYYCVLCNHFLSRVTFRNDFLPPTGDEMKFLLPRDWSGEEKQKWYEEFKIRRLAQEKVREHILEHGKE